MVFEKFAPFIQEYIYKNGWDELRDVQIAAADVIFNTDCNLLLTTPTASGKTEAAFFPIISELYNDMPKSFGVLYIAPLKSLINDQFLRLDELLDESGIPVCHWHGDVAVSQKAKALRNPSGILQITPESLESMLINRSNDIPRLFEDLRYIVIDELHTLTGTDRGNQIICQLSRISELIGSSPRRIGLSATVGDVQSAVDWLAAGSGHETICPPVSNTKLKWRLGAEQFYIGTQGLSKTLSEEDKKVADCKKDENNAENPNENSDENQLENEKSAVTGHVEPTKVAAFDPGYDFVYNCVKNKKCIVFSNSREETEYITATLRQIAEKRGERDFVSIHHGNLSASIRESAELDLKNDEIINTTCATVTLELGIDVGKLERIIQIEAPNSVSSFLQRMGRSGRRGTPPEMMMVFREESPLPDTPLPKLIPWQLLQAVAVVQLYAEERFIEPPIKKTMPFSLMFQQTLSILLSFGELTPKRLATKILSLPPFKNVTKDEYKCLLLSMIANDFIEKTEDGGLIVGLSGEKITSSFKFYAVFKDSEDFTVRCGSDEIGTITSPPPIGDRFALAGRVWEVEELDKKGKLVFCKAVTGKMEVSWPGDYGEIHTKILKRMLVILKEDKIYPYLKPNAAKRIEEVRALARKTGITKSPIISLGGYTYAIFPWIGTRSFRALRKILAQFKTRYKLSAIDYERCYYISFRMEKGKPQELWNDIINLINRDDFDLHSVVSAEDTPLFDKYDEYIPEELLSRAYVADRLSNPKNEIFNP